MVAVFALVLLGWAAVALLGGGGGTLARWVIALLILAFTFGLLGYFVLLDALNGGRTLRKQAVRIRDVMGISHPVTGTAAVERQLFRLTDCQPLGLTLPP